MPLLLSEGNDALQNTKVSDREIGPCKEVVSVGACSAGAWAEFFSGVQLNRTAEDQMCDLCDSLLAKSHK